LLREGLKPFLQQLGDDITILEAADYGETRDAAAGAQDLRLILLDLGMPGMAGMGGVEALHGDHPDIPLMILSGDTRPATVRGAFQAGASGFIAKTISGAALVEALRLVLAGESYLPPEIAASLEAGRGVDSETGATDATALCRTGPIEGLSPRDRTILALVVEGLTNKEIGRRLGLQEVTIKAHLRGLYRKIGAANRAQAVRITLLSQ
jgi:DNA-binding NarL/FixJ family response regulator